MQIIQGTSGNTYQLVEADVDFGKLLKQVASQISGKLASKHGKPEDFRYDPREEVVFFTYSVPGGDKEYAGFLADLKRAIPPIVGDKVKKYPNNAVQFGDEDKSGAYLVFALAPEPATVQGKQYNYAVIMVSFSSVA